MQFCFVTINHTEHGSSTLISQYAMQTPVISSYNTPTTSKGLLKTQTLVITISTTSQPTDIFITDTPTTDMSDTSSGGGGILIAMVAGAGGIILC